MEIERHMKKLQQERDEHRRERAVYKKIASDIQQSGLGEPVKNRIRQYAKSLGDMDIKTIHSRVQEAIQTERRGTINEIVADINNSGLDVNGRNSVWAYAKSLGQVDNKIIVRKVKKRNREESQK